jgi:hypothetical protein
MGKGSVLAADIRRAARWDAAAALAAHIKIALDMHIHSSM